jgi:hypothetical protein
MTTTLLRKIGVGRHFTGTLAPTEHCVNWG